MWWQWWGGGIVIVSGGGRIISVGYDDFVFGLVFVSVVDGCVLVLLALRQAILRILKTLASQLQLAPRMGRRYPLNC